MAHFHCFADVRVNEYLFGEGPPNLTVSMFRDSLFLDVWEGYEDVTEEQIRLSFDDAASRTADAYEGLEVFLFLRRPATIAVEAWVARLDMAYTEFIRQVKQASENRIAVIGGRIGKDSSLPQLVTDANYLHIFYGAIGAVYDGEGATVLPPRPPSRVACSPTAQVCSPEADG